jgi:hypothetical protein
MRRRLLTVAGLVMASALSATPAVAQQYPPEPNLVMLSDTNVVSGQSVTITAGSFLEGATVSFTFESDPVALGTATAESDGVATLTALIPTNASPGQHTITASGDSVNGPLVVSATLTVSADGTEAPAAANAAELPPTGVGDATTIAAVGAVIVLTLGAVLVLVARRRRYADT